MKNSLFGYVLRRKKDLDRAQSEYRTQNLLYRYACHKLGGEPHLFDAMQWQNEEEGIARGRAIDERIFSFYRDKNETTDL